MSSRGEDGSAAKSFTKLNRDLTPQLYLVRLGLTICAVQRAATKRGRYGLRRQRVDR